MPLAPNLLGFGGGFTKIIPSKSCQCSWRSVSCHQVEADIDLVVGKLHHTWLFPACCGQMWWWLGCVTIDFIAICVRRQSVVLTWPDYQRCNSIILNRELTQVLFCMNRVCDVVLRVFFGQHSSSTALLNAVRDISFCKKREKKETILTLQWISSTETCVKYGWTDKSLKYDIFLFCKPLRCMNAYIHVLGTSEGIKCP